MQSKNSSKQKAVKVRLRLGIGPSYHLETENGELLQNIYVKRFEQITETVNKLTLEVVYLADKNSFNNWSNGDKQ